MTKFFLMGVPYGFSCSQCNQEEYNVLSSYYTSAFNDKKFHFNSTKNGDVYYSYLIYPKKGEIFSDYNGRKGSFFGMSIVFKNQKVKDPNKVYHLLQAMYENIIKNRIIKEYDNGNKTWLVKSLVSEDDLLAKSVVKEAIKLMKAKPELEIKDEDLIPCNQPINIMYNIKTGKSL